MTADLCLVLLGLHHAWKAFLLYACKLFIFCASNSHIPSLVPFKIIHNKKLCPTLNCVVFLFSAVWRFPLICLNSCCRWFNFFARINSRIIHENFPSPRTVSVWRSLREIYSLECEFYWNLSSISISWVASMKTFLLSCVIIWRVSHIYDGQIPAFISVSASLFNPNRDNRQKTNLCPTNCGQANAEGLSWEAFVAKGSIQIWSNFNFKCRLK